MGESGKHRETLTFCLFGFDVAVLMAMDLYKVTAMMLYGV
jgi:hypothetical protein